MVILSNLIITFFCVPIDCPLTIRIHKLFLACYKLTDLLLFFLIVRQVIKKITSYASTTITCICNNMLVDLFLVTYMHNTMSHGCLVLHVM